MSVYEAYRRWAERTSRPFALAICVTVDRAPESQEDATWLWASLLGHWEDVGRRGKAIADQLRETATASTPLPWAVLRRRARQIESTHRTARGARRAEGRCECGEHLTATVAYVARPVGPLPEYRHAVLIEEIG